MINDDILHNYSSVFLSSLGRISMVPAVPLTTRVSPSLMRSHIFGPTSIKIMRFAIQYSKLLRNRRKITGDARNANSSTNHGAVRDLAADLEDDGLDLVQNFVPFSVCPLGDEDIASLDLASLDGVVEDASTTLVIAIRRRHALQDAPSPLLNQNKKK